MKRSIPHDLGKEGAKRAATAAFDHYKERFARYAPVATWVTDDRAEVSFTAKGITLRGTFEIRPASIDIDLDVPFVLRPFRSLALEKVERDVGRWADKVRRGEV